MKNISRLLTAVAVAIITTPLLNLGAHAVTYPTLIGHRGVGDPHTAALGIPENSVPAIQWAAAHHADIVEGDVRVSSSGAGTMYMMHDDTLDRTTNGTGSSYTRSWSYISQRWLEVPIDKDGNNDPDNTPYHPPSFRSWLAAAKGTGKLVFIELKGPGWNNTNVKRYVDEINRQGMGSKVITAGSVTELNNFKRYSSGKKSVNAEAKQSPSTLKTYVGSTGYVTMRLAFAEENRSYVTQLQSAGLKVLVWTLDNSSHYARALPIGAHGWMCDNTQDAWEWLEAHGA